MSGTTSEKILEEVVRLRKRGKTVDVEEEKTKFAICSLGNDLYGFFGEDIKEIFIADSISFVPGCPDLMPEHAP